MSQVFQTLLNLSIFNADIINTYNLNVSGTLSITSLTSSMPVKTDASDNLVSGQIILTSDVTGVLPIINGGTNSGTALTNGKIMVSSGGAIVEGTSSTSPSFSGTATVGQLIDSGLNTSQPVKTDTNKQLVSALINLNSDTTGAPLNIANGGTNSSSALTNTKLMVSSGGKIVEGTSSTDPIFSGIVQANTVSTNNLTLTAAGLLNKLIGTDNFGHVEALTLSSTNSNGTNNSLAFDGIAATLKLTSAMTQNLDTTGSPTFANLIDSGLAAAAGLVSQSAGKQ